MGTPLRVLIVEDSEDDAILVLRELRRADYDLTSERVDTPQAMNAALDQQTWDIVLCDYSMPRFSMPAALAMVKEKGLDLPFIIVSGAIGEEAAVAAMRAGAHDYVMKDDLARLAPAVERELREAETRRERKRMEESLRESEEHYSALVGNLTDAVFQFKGGIITWCNDRVEEIYGYAKDELLGKNASLFYPSDISPSEYIREVSTAIKEHGLFRSTSKFRKKDGSFVDIEYSLSQIPGKDPVEVIAVARDITERKQAEEEIRKFKTIADSAGYGVAMTDIEGNLVYVNESFATMHGYTADELIGKNPSIFHNAEQMHNVRRLNERLEQEGSYVAEEVWHKRKDNTVFPTLMNGTLVIDAQGEPLFMAATAIDITDRKRAEEALRESEKRYRLLADNATDVIWTVDLNMRLTYISPSVTCLLGYSVEEAMGRTMEETFTPASFEAAMKVFAEELAVENTKRKDVARSRTLQIELNRKDGSIVPVELNCTFLRESDGRPVEVLVIARDVTERKRAEEALQQREQDYSVLLESTYDGIAVVDAETLKLVFGNRRAAKMFGFDPALQDGSGLDILQFVHPDDKGMVMRAFAEDVYQQERRQRYELRAKTKDGRQIWVSALGTRIEFQGRLAVLLSMVDITEHKKAEEERKRLEQQLQLAGRLAAVGELAAGVAHELNNPLTAVQAFAQFLAERDNLDETIKSDLGTIYREAQRATRITANLLRFARRHKSEKQPLSINEALKKSLELHAYRMKASNIEVLVEPAPDLPMTMADSNQMHQVFVNIISNAEQAMTEAHSKGKLCVKTQRVGEMIRIAFTDDGPGISEDNLKRIFDPFFTTKDVGKGTGLGLSICFGIVEEHGGHMYARSKPGKGATFVVELPVVSEDHPIAEQASSIEG